MEHSGIDMETFSQTESLQRKQGSQWVERHCADLGGNQVSLVQPSKYHADIVTTDNYIETLMPIRWWKDTAIMKMNNQLEYLSQNVSAPDHELTGNTLDLQLTTQLSEESNSNIKIQSKSKLQKKQKIVKEHRLSMKRAKNPERWKVNIKKTARLRGEQYVGVGGKVVPAKIMGLPCKCRMRCSEKISEAAREELHNIFWKTCNWEQRKQYIALSVKESPKQRTRCRGNVKSEHRRQVTFTYSLLIKGEFITVCKCMFLSTFAVSEKFVRHAMNKKRTSPGGIIGPDLRGRHTPKTKKSETIKDRVREHIKSFPREKSSDPLDSSDKEYLNSKLSIAAMHKLYVEKCKMDGVLESEIVKESYYREMFKNEFNLGFKHAKSKEGTQVQNQEPIGHLL